MTPPEPLSAAHDLSGFDCGRPSMNDWLQQRALKWQSNNGARVVVLAEASAVRAYYALSSGAVRRAEAPKAMGRSNPDPLPIILLGRMAVDQRLHGQGVARDLMLDAFDRTYAVSQQVGVVALVVHALDEDLAGFYQKFGFYRAPQTAEALTFFKPMKDIAAEIEASL